MYFTHIYNTAEFHRTHAWYQCSSALDWKPAHFPDNNSNYLQFISVNLISSLHYLSYRTFIADICTQPGTEIQ